MGDSTRAGGKAAAPQGDVAKTADVERVLAEPSRQVGPIDILVLLAIREALQHFATNGGSIINIGSVVSRVTPPQNALYVATKRAVDGITRFRRPSKPLWDEFLEPTSKLRKLGRSGTAVTLSLFTTICRSRSILTSIR